MIKYKFLIGSINFFPSNTEQSKNLQIFFFDIFRIAVLNHAMLSKILNDLFINKIVNKKIIISQ